MSMIHLIASLAFDGGTSVHTSSTHERLLTEHFKGLSNVHPLLLLRVKERIVVDFYAVFVEIVLFFWFPFS